VKRKFENESNQYSEIERQWIEKIHVGDVVAFELLFRTYYPRLCRFVQRMVQSHPIAEEIVQELFLSIWEHRETWQPRSSIRKYLYRAVKNSSLNHLNHQKIVKDWEGEELYTTSMMSESNPEREVFNNELANAIQKAIDRLPERCRLTFTLHRQDGLTYAEIASVLNVSIKTVETQMGRALKTLRSLLLPYLS
jgi:RNA polymerase sigma-70 factor (ECF subfamily)